jgi:hypothetical protein
MSRMVLCTCVHDPCTTGQQASHEERERVLLLRFLVANLDDLRERLGDEYHPFAKELHQRILPVVRAHKDGHDDVSTLQSLADDIKEQLLTWPGEKAKVLKQMAAHAARDAAGLVLPKRWREKQELLKFFQLMYVKLEKGREEPREDLQAGSSDGEKSKGCIDTMHAAPQN